MKKDNAAHRARRGREFWLEQLQACERAGLTVRAFAQEHGLNEHTAYNWRKVLRAEGALPDGETSDTSDGSPWARVEIAPVTTARYRLELPNGVALELAGGFDDGELARLLRVAGGP